MQNTMMVSTRLPGEIKAHIQMSPSTAHVFQDIAERNLLDLFIRSASHVSKPSFVNCKADQQ